MVLAAVRIVSRRRLMSFSWESATPMRLRYSRDVKMCSSNPRAMARVSACDVTISYLRPDESRVTEAPPSRGAGLGRACACPSRHDPGPMQGNRRRTKVRFARHMQASLDADRAHLRHVSNALQCFFDAVHLQRAHAFGECSGEHFRDARMLLDVLLEGVGADQQLVQSEPP